MYSPLSTARRRFGWAASKGLAEELQVLVQAKADLNTPRTQTDARRGRRGKRGRAERASADQADVDVPGNGSATLVWWPL